MNNTFKVDSNRIDSIIASLYYKQFQLPEGSDIPDENLDILTAMTQLVDYGTIEA